MGKWNSLFAGIYGAIFVKSAKNYNNYWIEDALNERKLNMQEKIASKNNDKFSY